MTMVSDELARHQEGFHRVTAKLKLNQKGIFTATHVSRDAAAQIADLQSDKKWHHIQRYPPAIGGRDTIAALAYAYRFEGKAIRLFTAVE